MKPTLTLLTALLLAPLARAARGDTDIGRKNCRRAMGAEQCLHGAGEVTVQLHACWKIIG